MLIRIQFIVVILLSLVLDKSCAQYKDNYWVFGDSVAINWINPNTPIIENSAFNWRNGSCSVGDSLGVLLYSGLFNNILPINNTVWNKFHTSIQDGDHIYGNAWYHSGLFIPNPSNDSIFILFTCGVNSSEPY